MFDTETTVDAAQRLRLGAYQLRNRDELVEGGLLYEPSALKSKEIDAIRSFAAAKALTVRTVSSFVDDVLYDRAYDLRASIVGFNLPFDLSRLAIKHGSARGKAMRGGFTLKLSDKSWRPAIQVRHLNAKASLIQFTHPPRLRDSRGERRRSLAPRERRGSFIDLKTIGAALFSRSFSLASLANSLKTATRKGESGGHGETVTAEYLTYAVQDVQTTWECYRALQNAYALHRLTETPISKILSEATLGKSYLKEMGIRPFRELQPDFPDAVIGKIMSAYYGGRAEVRIRRKICQILYCDFKSMYPTVCTLMGLWSFVRAKGMDFVDATEETRDLVNAISLGDLRRLETWPQLTTIVRVRPQADIFPIRAKYDGRSQTIGLNILTSASPLWFTLADVVATKMLSGKPPEILEAISFSPREAQTDLKAISIAGNPEFRVDPSEHDFFKRLIDLRTVTQDRIKGADSERRGELDSAQQALKILANATSYGIFVEMNVADLDEESELTCYGPGERSFTVRSAKVEEPGRYFHPLLATLITGAARLMLAIAETLCVENGLDWAFCDTDSLAIATPAAVGPEEFFPRAQQVCDWFTALNPYEKKGSIFKIEKANYPISEESGASKFEPLYCFCISAKRYALFNLGLSGEIIIRKASAHGLGQYLEPYEENDAPSSIPAPAVGLSEIGLARWQYDLWYSILRATVDGHPDQVDLSYHPGLNQPAASRFAATTPKLLRWFKTFNSSRSLQDQVKPFNFMISFQARPSFEVQDDEYFVSQRRGRPRKRIAIKPVAPFDRSVTKAAKAAFDRESGKLIAAAQLTPNAEALAQYHLHPEMKFRSGDFLDRGRTERRHVVASKVVHIGKEANKWEEQYFLGADESLEIEYGVELNLGETDLQIREMCEILGERETARRISISRTTLRAALKRGVGSLTPAVRKRMRSGRGVI